MSKCCQWNELLGVFCWFIFFILLLYQYLKLQNIIHENKSTTRILFVVRKRLKHCQCFIWHPKHTTRWNKNFCPVPQLKKAILFQEHQSWNLRYEIYYLGKLSFISLEICQSQDDMPALRRSRKKGKDETVKPDVAIRSSCLQI